MVRRRAIAAASLTGLAALVGASSCGSSGSGGSDESTTKVPPYVRALLSTTVPAQAREALGDLRTLDPCSLVDLAMFKDFGAAAFADPQSMDYCVVLVQTAGGQQEVHVGEILDASTPPMPTGTAAAVVGAEELSGGQTLFQGGFEGSSCQDRVDFTDRLGLLASAVAPDGAPATETTCNVAGAAMAGALTSVQAGRVTHRSYPARSFGPVDPCTVLTAAAVTKTVPALADAQPVSHPAQHQCEFGARGATTAYAALVLGAAYQRFDGGPTSTTITVAGHQVVLIPTYPTGRPTECTGYGPHIAFPSRSGQPAMEMAELHVSLPDGSPEGQSCRAVQSLAETVFRRLP